MSDDLQGLRDAVRVSPDNIPLRQHLADTLLARGRLEDAEKEYREALSRAPNDQWLKIGLARAFYQQGKNSQALVIIEDLIKGSNPPAPAYVLHARLLVRGGEIRRAVHQYRQAIEADPSVADLELAGQLGINANPDSEVVEGRVRASWEAPNEGADTEIERPKINFADVGGMDKLKEEIRMKIILPLTNPDLFKAYGKTAGGGILMYGPPGCGKTYLARATAGEVKAGFIAVGISDVLDMWIGNSERNLHEIFERARRNAPCVLFFDEVDALGASRSDMRHHGGRHLINQFLSELDGVNASNEGVLILAATNAPWHVDSAFRRPGRFDRILFVPPPDLEARSVILRLMLRGKPAQDLDYPHLAKKTDQFSGADLKGMVDVAVEAKLREAMQAGSVKPLTTRDLTGAAGSVRPSTKEWFATARNHAIYANQGGLYDDVLKYLKIQMSAHYERAWILYQQARPEMAIAELRRELAISPDFAGAHALLALCLVRQQEYAAAQREAEQAVSLAPDMPLVYHALAHVLFERRRYEEAEDAVLEAIRLNPAEADYFALLGDIRMALRDWRGALDAAEQGLREDPEHVSCNNVRAVALVHMGRRGEAGQTLDATLHRDPDNAMTHANQGWALLHSNQPRAAMGHFREALRLQPEMEWARSGIVEALKAHNPIYRVFLIYFLWMSRLSALAQWGVVLGGYFGMRILSQIAADNPAAAPIIYPIVIIYTIFALMTWLAHPLFNLLLRLNKFGRLALSREQIVASNWLGGCLLSAALALIAGLILGDTGLVLIAAGLGVLTIPVAAIFLCPAGWPRGLMIGYTLFICLFFLLGIALHYGGYPDVGLASGLLFMLGALLATWFANLLMLARPRR